MAETMTRLRCGGCFKDWPEGSDSCGTPECWGKPEEWTPPTPEQQAEWDRQVQETKERAAEEARLKAERIKAEKEQEAFTAATRRKDWRQQECVRLRQELQDAEAEYGRALKHYNRVAAKHGLLEIPE